MSFPELLVIAVGLSLDAFAVAVCRTACQRSVNVRRNVGMAASFGLFQALMPAAGWLIGTRFGEAMERVDHWVAFVLLTLIGAKMLYGTFHDRPEAQEECRLISLREILLLSVATSIDALAIGIVFAALKAEIILSSAMIGTVTFLLSLSGVSIGGRLGAKFGARAQIAGSVVLIGAGFKILLEHVGAL